MILPKYEITKLKNGLRVILVPNKHVDSIDVSIMFRVGSRCEREDIAGISHFLEHMFFKGTKKRPKAQNISEAVDSVGGYMNAFTSQEYTGYYIKVAKQYTELAVDVLSDMILNSKFDSKEIARERNVIKEEMKMYEDTPIQYVWNLWNEVLYGKQGLGRDIAGSFKSLDNIDRGSMVGYRDSYYSVANGLMVIVGNFEEKKLMALLNKYWSGIPDGDKSVFGATDDSQKKSSLNLLYRDIQQANFCLGVRAYKSFDPKQYINAVMSIVLGEGMSSRLFLKVRERRGLAYSIWSGADTYTDVGNFVVKTGTDDEKAEKAIKLILEEFDVVKQKLISAKEISKAKNYFKGKMILSLENPEAIASMVGMQTLLHEKVISPDKIMAKIDAVTAEQVRDLAREMFVPEKLNLAIIGPFKNEDKFKKLLKI